VVEVVLDWLGFLCSCLMIWVFVPLAVSVTSHSVCLRVTSCSVVHPLRCSSLRCVMSSARGSVLLWPFFTSRVPLMPGLPLAPWLLLNSFRDYIIPGSHSQHCPRMTCPTAIPCCVTSATDLADVSVEPFSLPSSVSPSAPRDDLSSTPKLSSFVLGADNSFALGASLPLGAPCLHYCMKKGISI